MATWMKRAKDTMKVIIDNIQNTNPELEIRVSFVGYRDHCDINRIVF